MKTDRFSTPPAHGASTAARRAAGAPGGRQATLAPAEQRAALALAGCLVALLLAPLTAADAAGRAPRSAGASTTATAASARFGPAVLAELSRIRARNGLPAVALDTRMSRTAAAHSREIARRGSFTHGSWDSRVARAAGSARELGETLGWLRRSRPAAEARGIVRGWLNSPPHRAVLLAAGFRRVGIGRAGGRLNGVDAAIYTVDWASAR